MVERGKKLRGNGMWEASRMMLPEHRAAIRSHRTRLRERVKPELDEQRIEELSFALQEALESGEETAITTFGLYDDETEIGIVAKIDVLERCVKLVREREAIWIPFADIVQVEPQRRRRKG